MTALLKKIYHFLIAYLSYFYYGRPSKKLIVVGVTGTKGKSTTCRFVASVLQAGGYKVGLLTTVEFQIGNKRELNKEKMTMLGRGQIQKKIKEMVKAGCQYAVIETSSEGILQNRHLCLNYDVAVFTNLGTEHQERHGGFENLKRDKGKLFAALSRCKKIVDGKEIKKVIVVNGDDENAGYYLEFDADEKYGYGLKDKQIDGLCIKYHVSCIKGQITNSDEHGSECIIHNTLLLHLIGGQVGGQAKYIIQLVGEFNVYNALAAVAVGRSQKISDEQIASGLKSVEKVEGRMEFIDEGQDFKVVVDYAHEPLSFTELFKVLRSMLVRRSESEGGLRSNSRLIAVVGSDGGGRDKSKREKMGEIAGELADIVIVTDVNCFDEDPKEIAEMLAVGARQANKHDEVDLFIETDRRQAIKDAVSMAKPNDIVVITAKGTEPCMVMAYGKKVVWDDREEVRNALKI